jgi:adenine-specific DNA-methyltransferase
MPKAFLDHYGGWTVIENHLNIVKPTEDTRVSLEVISALLNSHTVDQVFRCMSGSVAVSAYELNALPLPDIQDLDALGDLIKSSRGKDEIETFIGRLYGEA